MVRRTSQSSRHSCSRGDLFARIALALARARCSLSHMQRTSGSRTADTLFWVPPHGDEVTHQWKGRLPCHPRQCGQVRRSRLYRRANPVILSSIARLRLNCTVARGSQSNKTCPSAFLRHFIVTPKTTARTANTTAQTKDHGPTTGLRTSTLHHHDNRVHRGFITPKY